MSERKCVYTNKSSKAKDSVIPKKHLDGEIYNWANTVPCSLEYKELKEDRMPTEDEMLANELFQNLELSRLRVRYYETKLSEVQERLSKQLPTNKPPSKKQAKKKEKEIAHAIHDVKVVQKVEENLDKVLSEMKEETLSSQNKNKKWDWD